ncbi:MAG: MarR family transcriptional regulator [Tidjanibacter sp.]|nr:MarR family transcriptional regulator [Tidjanibacter sp.]
MGDPLLLQNQLCFPLYAAAKETVRCYRAYLDPLGLTYTQYIAMMALWEHKKMTISEMGRLLYLDSGTLTPMLKKMEQAGLLMRTRSATDERNVEITLTDAGWELREKAMHVPSGMAQFVNLEPGEVIQLYHLLYKLLDQEVCKR